MVIETLINREYIRHLGGIYVILMGLVLFGCPYSANECPITSKTIHDL